MHVLQRAAIVLYMEGGVSVVVVIGLLAMHDQVLQLAYLLPD
jgi:hypothetical protein